jgi:hypothetical protein
MVCFRSLNLTHAANGEDHISTRGEDLPESEATEAIVTADIGSPSGYTVLRDVCWGHHRVPTPVLGVAGWYNHSTLDAGADPRYKDLIVPRW